MTFDETLLESFIEATQYLTYRPKSVFPSEMFMFYHLVSQTECTHIIESGIGYGGSTDYLDALFPDKQITSIDLGKVKQTRKLHPRIKFIQGDGSKVIPRLVASGDPVAILIDGPKGKHALRIVDNLRGKRNVKLIAVHDLPGETQSEEYRKRFGFLDEKVGTWLHTYPKGPGLKVFNA